MQQKQILEQHLRQKPLTEAYQELEGKRWDKINSNPRAFLPREHRGYVSLDKIRAENIALGRFAVDEVGRRIFQKSRPEDIARRISGEKKIVFGGYGQRYDSGLIKLATLAGYQIWIIDISRVSCDMATNDVFAMWGDIESKVAIPPIIHQGDIRSILLRPEDAGLDIGSVEGYYMCRILSALSMVSAKIVLQKMGESLSRGRDFQGDNWIFTVNPLGEHNPHRITKTSIVLTENRILSNVRRGAGRRIVSEEASQSYFERLYTSMLIKAG